MKFLQRYAKAFIGAAVAGLNVAYQALDDNTITGKEWISILIGVLTVGGGVWYLPNKDPEGEHQDESVQPPDVEVAPLED